MLIWWCIHFAHYYLGKRIITGVSEEKLVEIMSTPLFYRRNQRASKKLERYAFIPILLIYVPIVWLYTLLFKEIQQIILPAEGITFASGYIIFPAIFVGIGTSLYIVFRIAAHQETIPKEKWVVQPTLKECQERIKKLKRIGIRWSWIIQILFMTTMLFYTNIGNKGITHSGFLNLGATIYPYSDIDYVKTSVKTQQVSSDGSAGRDKFIYRYFIMLDNGEMIELWDLLNELGWSQRKVEKLKQATYYLRENKVNVIVKYPSFFDWATYKRIRSAKHYQQLKNYFDEVRDVAEGVSGVTPIGENVTIDSVIYRIDSVTTDSKNGIFAAPKNKTYLFVHITAHNENTDSFYVSPFDFEIHDRLDNAYRHSIFANDTFNDKVPSNETRSGSFGFDIPKDVPLPLNLRYEEGVLDKRYYWFELIDSTESNLFE
jgi:hypothetical protein